MLSSMRSRLRRFGATSDQASFGYATAEAVLQIRLRSLAAIGLVLVMVPWSLTPSAVAANPKAEQIARSVTIYRDSYGVPHVYGPTDASCVFGYIYAQAEDNFWQIEDSYIRSLGRGAEVYGDSAVAQDLLNH